MTIAIAWPLYSDINANPYADDPSVNLFPLGYGLNLRSNVSDEIRVVPENDRSVGVDGFRLDRSHPHAGAYQS